MRPGRSCNKIVTVPVAVRKLDDDPVLLLLVLDEAVPMTLLLLVPLDVLAMVPAGVGASVVEDFVVVMVVAGVGDAVACGAPVALPPPPLLPLLAS